MENPTHFKIHSHHFHVEVDNVYVGCKRKKDRFSFENIDDILEATLKNVFEEFPEFMKESGEVVESGTHLSIKRK